MKRVAIALLLVLLAACDREVPAGSMTAAEIRFEHAIYFLPPGPPPSPAIAARFPQRMPVTPRVESHAGYPPPDVETLRDFGRGLTPAQVQAVQQSKGALVLELVHPQKDVWRGLRHAAELTAAIARDVNGLIYDPATGELFTAEAWERERLSPWKGELGDVSDHMLVQVYQDGEYVRAVTAGMKKFGLPELVVEELTWSQQRPIVHTINLLAQALAEGTPVGTDGAFDLDLRGIRHPAVRDAHLSSLGEKAQGKARLLLRRSHDGLVKISFDAYEGNDSHAKREAMLMALFGSKDETANVDHDEKVREASRIARRRLPELRAAFNAGLPRGQSILLKAPFATGDGNTEWMWVEVTRWNDDAIRGLLMNEPNRIRDLHAGQQVTIREEKVFDWIRQYPDGRREGNATAAVLYPNASH